MYFKQLPDSHFVFKCANLCMKTTSNEIIFAGVLRVTFGKQFSCRFFFHFTFYFHFTFHTYTKMKKKSTDERKKKLNEKQANGSSRAERVRELHCYSIYFACSFGASDDFIRFYWPSPSLSIRSCLFTISMYPYVSICVCIYENEHKFMDLCMCIFLICVLFVKKLAAKWNVCVNDTHSNIATKQKQQFSQCIFTLLICWCWSRFLYVDLFSLLLLLFCFIKRFYFQSFYYFICFGGCPLISFSIFLIILFCVLLRIHYSFFYIFSSLLLCSFMI